MSSASNSLRACALRPPISRIEANTRYPCPASNSAVTRPNPVLAPVIRTTPFTFTLLGVHQYSRLTLVKDAQSFGVACTPDQHHRPRQNGRHSFPYTRLSRVQRANPRHRPSHYPRRADARHPGRVERRYALLSGDDRTPAARPRGRRPGPIHGHFGG